MQKNQSASMPFKVQKIILVSNNHTSLQLYK